MRQQRVSKFVLTAIGNRIGRVGARRRLEAQSVAMNIVAIFAIVQQRDPITGSERSAHFWAQTSNRAKSQLVFMWVGTFKMAVLNFVRRIHRADFHRKRHLKQLLVFLPVDVG